MSLLVDTHALYWFMTDDDRLPRHLRTTMATARVSAVSVWELEIKRAAGKLELDLDVAAEVTAAGFEELSVTIHHAAAAGRLPPHHSDPFDRMLVAQARMEGLVLVTRDTAIRRYDVPTLWD